MYYEEKQEGLVWYWRGGKNHPWHSFTLEQYQKKIVELKQEIQTMHEDAAGIDL